MPYQRETWEKTRGRRDYFTEAERALIEQKHAAGFSPREIAAELKCATRSISRRIAQLEGRPQAAYRRPRKHRIEVARHIGQRKPQPDPAPRKQTEAERRAARFYRGNFDL